MHTLGSGDRTHSNPGPVTHMIQGDIEKGVGGVDSILPWYLTDLSMILTKGDIKY